METRRNELLRFERTSVPTLTTTALGALPSEALDHRGGFLLSLLDGTTDLETVLDLCAMPAQEALTLLSALNQRAHLAAPHRPSAAINAHVPLPPARPALMFAD